MVDCHIRETLPFRAGRSHGTHGSTVPDKVQTTLRFPSVAQGPCAMLGRPNYSLEPHEYLLARREVFELIGAEAASDDSVPLGATDAHEALAAGVRLAFWHSVGITEPEIADIPTLQRLLERPASNRRKHVAYATHGLHRYKGKFYPQLAKTLINLSGLPSTGAMIVDPFGGSGTTLLEAVLNGHDAVSIDCNPLAAMIAQCKIDSLGVDADVLLRDSEALIKAIASSTQPTSIDWGQFDSSVHNELDSWFAPTVLAKMSHVLRHARKSRQPELVALYEVIASSLVREVSQQEPRDLRRRRRLRPITDAAVAEVFTDRLRRCVAKIRLYHDIDDSVKPPMGSGRTVLGSSTDPDSYSTLDGAGTLVDCVITSPPYATALPYLDTDRLSLAAICGVDNTHRNALEGVLVGSRETSKSEMADCESLIRGGSDTSLPATTLALLRDLLEAVASDPSAGFRKQQLPTALCKYFVGITHVMAQLGQRMRQGGHLWLVLGDSSTTLGGRKRPIPTVDEVAAISVLAGFDEVERILISVTREDVAHAKHSITENAIVHLRSP